MLALVALTSGLARRVSQESQRQQLIALDRLGKLAEANALLFSLQRVAQTLPASLDLDDVLDSTLTRLRPLIEADAVTVLLYSEPDRSWDAVRTRGYRGPGGYSTEHLALPLRDAMLSSRSITVADLGRDGPGVADGMASGIYASLRARGTLMGLIALESREPDFFAVQHTELLNGFIEPFGIAIDNARLFRRLRSIGADEERSRIARELHDRIGNALAMIGFEVDGLTLQAQRGGDVAAPLSELRLHVSAVVGDVREALYDLRTDVSESQDLVATLTMFCERVRNRSSLDVTFDADATAPFAPPPGARALADLTRGDHQRRAPRTGGKAHRELDVQANGGGVGHRRRRSGFRQGLRSARLLRARRHAGTSGERERRSRHHIRTRRRDDDSIEHGYRNGRESVSLRLMLVDDHRMLREGLRRALEAEGFIVVAEASDGHEALKLALERKPDVILMDVSMPDIDGIEATRAIMQADARQRIVMLTMHMDRDIIDRAIKAGAVGYLTKDCSVTEVADACRMAANGDLALSPKLAELMLSEARKSDLGEERLITKREEEVLQLIADGLSTPEVASKLYISQKTVKNHLASIYEKLNARDRTQAVLLAVRMGIVKLT